MMSLLERLMPPRDALQRPIIERRRDSPRTQRVRVGAGTLADILAPDGIERRASGLVQVGDSYITTLEVRAFPPTLDLGWLTDARIGLDAPGITVHQRIEPINDRLARRLLARSEDAALMTLTSDSEAGSHLDADAQLGMEAAAALRNDLAAGTDRMYQYGITITIAAPSQEKLEQRVTLVRQAAAQAGVLLAVARFQQWEGYLDSLPMAGGELTKNGQGLLHDTSGRAIAMGLPTAAPGLSGSRGLPLIWGEHPRTGAPIIWDRWQATNPHALIVAESGSGKTYTISGLMAQEVALGEDALLILDPKYQEYRNLVTALGGAYITLSNKAGYHINPLALPPLSNERVREVGQLEEDLLGQRIGVIKAIITREFRAMGMPADPVQMALIERAILEAYQTRGISNDPGTFSRPMPTFSDVQARLEDLALHDPDARLLARAMSLFTSGSIGEIFNKPSNIPTHNPLLALDLSVLLRVNDEALERIIPIIVMDFFVMVAINRPTGRRSHLVLDEAHALLHSEAGARTMETIFRIGRSLQFKATVVTQSLSDLKGSAYTQALLENSKTKLILGLNRDSDAVAFSAELLGLNEQEEAYLASCRLIKGIGATALLLADGERTPLLIPQWPETLHAIITGEDGLRLASHPP